MVMGVASAEGRTPGQTATSVLERHWAPLLVVITFASAAVRLWGLGAESLWTDELTTARMTLSGPLEAWRQAAADTSPPLYYVLQALVLRWLPAGEVSLRLLSVLCGVATIPVVAALGRWLFSPSAGLLAGSMFAFSWSAILLGQEARAYSLATLCVSIAALTLTRALSVDDGRRRALWLGAHGLAALVALYSHWFSLLALAGIEVAVLSSRAGRQVLGRVWVASLALVGMGFVPWLAYLPRQAARVSGAIDAGQWVLAPPGALASELLRALRLHAAWGPRPGWFWIAFWLLAAGGVAAVLRAPGRQREPGSAEPRAVAIIVWWLAAVWLGGAALSLWVLPVFGWRSAFLALPAACLLAARAILGLSRVRAGLAAVAVLVLLLLGMLDLRAEAVRPRWRAVTQKVSEQAGSVDIMVVSAPFVLDNLTTYAAILGSALPERVSTVPRTDDSGAIDGALRRALDTADSASVVLGHLDFGPDGASAVDEGLARLGWRMAEERAYGGRIGGEVYVRTYLREGGTP